MRNIIMSWKTNSEKDLQQFSKLFEIKANSGRYSEDEIEALIPYSCSVKFSEQNQSGY